MRHRDLRSQQSQLGLVERHVRTMYCAELDCKIRRRDG